MSYSTIAVCVGDVAFLSRLNACVASEQGAHSQNPDPSLWNEPFRWIVASASDVAAAYASALANDNPNPGGDESVITDVMILSNVQAHWDAVTKGPVP